jgi:hypothetical protein
MSVEKREVSFDTRAKENVLRHVGSKNPRGIGFTTGEWRGVTTLERVKSRGHVPPRRPDRIRVPKAGARLVSPGRTSPAKGARRVLHDAARGSTLPISQ